MSGASSCKRFWAKHDRCQEPNNRERASVSTIHSLCRSPHAYSLQLIRRLLNLDFLCFGNKSRSNRFFRPSEILFSFFCFCFSAICSSPISAFNGPVRESRTGQRCETYIHFYNVTLYSGYVLCYITSLLC